MRVHKSALAPVHAELALRAQLQGPRLRKLLSEVPRRQVYCRGGSIFWSHIPVVATVQHVTQTYLEITFVVIDGPHIPNMALVSDSSNIFPHEIGNCLGLRARGLGHSAQPRCGSRT